MTTQNEQLLKEFREKIRGHSLGALGYDVQDIEKWLLSKVKEAREEGFNDGYKTAEKEVQKDIAENYTPNEYNRKVKIG
jgi:hypothetical protein